MVFLDNSACVLQVSKYFNTVFTAVDIFFIFFKLCNVITQNVMHIINIYTCTNVLVLIV
jgi:hypothetical protein